MDFDRCTEFNVCDQKKIPIFLDVGVIRIMKTFFT